MKSIILICLRPCMRRRRLVAPRFQLSVSSLADCLHPAALEAWRLLGAHVLLRWTQAVDGVAACSNSRGVGSLWLGGMLRMANKLCELLRRTQQDRRLILSRGLIAQLMAKSRVHGGGDE
jgi:hypothetical protein